MTETLIKVDSLSKRFCRSLKRSLWYGLQDLGSELRGRRHGGNGELRPEEFWAVKDINFELSRGECLGLIGHNGAGKTTLLRMLNGLIKPDQGRIEMHGQVGALIALGAGFNPILTGRENIYISASVLGLSKRHVDTKLDEIIDFAEINEFIDTPVQNYSSGMNVRLGFAVAAVLIEPDILFLDEVLAVGDIGFVIKCLNTVRRLTENSAVVFVSHNMQNISSFCTRVMVMDHGTALLDTDNLAEGIDRYFSLVKHGKHDVQISGTGEAQVLGLDLIVDGETLTEKEPSVNRGSLASALLRIQVSGPRTGAYVSINVLDETMSPIISTPIRESESKLLCIPPGEHQIKIPLWEIDLNGGNYSFVVAMRDVDTSVSLARVQGLRPFRVLSDGAYWSKVVRPTIANIDSLSARRPEEIRIAVS